jgi:putative RecB family exonuclease
MAIVQSLQDFQHDLHISYSQIFTYLACSLKYKFQYVENRPFERVSINLFLGSAIHTAIAHGLKTLKEKNVIEPLSHLTELFEDCISLELDNTEIPLIHKKEAPDRTCTVKLGKAMLKAWYESINLSGFKIVDIEIPLSGSLFTDNYEKTDMKLIGIIDLLLMDESNSPVVVDHKTSIRSKSQRNVDDDLQFSAYSYLLASNRFTSEATEPVKCRMDVIRKLKAPKVETYNTVRTAADRRRFAKIANAVLMGIESKVYIPNRSWLCSDCQFVQACKSWGTGS